MDALALAVDQPASLAADGLATSVPATASGATIPVDSSRRVLAHGLDHRRVAQPVAIAQGVGRVPLPAVIGITGAEGGARPPRSPGADDEHGRGSKADDVPNSPLPGSGSRAQARTPAVGLAPPLACWRRGHCADQRRAVRGQRPRVVRAAQWVGSARSRNARGARSRRSVPCADECLVTPDGWCEHGLASWQLILDALD